MLTDVQLYVLPFCLFDDKLLLEGQCDSLFGYVIPNVHHNKTNLSCILRSIYMGVIPLQAVNN